MGVLSLLSVLSVLFPTALAPAADGPTACGWRGDGTGLYPSATPPTEWDIDEGKNILWKAEVGKGQSTPVVVRIAGNPPGDRVLVTAEHEWLLCVDRASGKVLWKADNGYAALPAGSNAPDKRPPASPNCGYSTPTPVTDGKLVYASYGTGIVACFGLDGHRQWIRYLDVPQATQYGRAASPLLAAGRLIVSLGGLMALDAKSGRTLWHQPEAKPTYGTPALARIGDADVAITPNGDCVRLADGKILAKELAESKYISPLVQGGVVYFGDTTAAARKLPAKAGETLELPILWEADLEGEFFASPLLHEGILYCVSNGGTLSALDARTGKPVFQQELEIPNASGRPGTEAANIYPSLALVGKHLLVGNDIGVTLVLAPGKEYKQISRNFLDKGSGASPVADGKQLFLRGGTRLYCIGTK